MVAFVGEQVTIRYDPRDLAEIKVYFTDGAFLCKAVCQDIADLTISLRELLSTRKAVKKALDGQVKDSKHLLRSLIATTPQKPIDISEPIQKSKSTLKCTQMIDIFEDFAPQPFIQTKEYLRFEEFAQSCSQYKYIGICYGNPGVGKTYTANEYAQPQVLEY